MKNLLTASFIAALTLFINPSVTEAEDRRLELSFPPNGISTVVSEELVRGNRHHHYFTAQEGQFIAIALISVENNGAFSLLYRQNGMWRERVFDQRTWSGVLPSSDNNRYIISVGGMRGNVTYDLFVGISPVSRTGVNSKTEAS